MTINKDLLQRVLAKIEADPKSWDQAHWFCGTTACFAGHTCLLAGDTPILCSDADGSYGTHVYANATSITARRRATQLLGLAVYEADYLFDAWNTLDDLRHMVNNLLEDLPIDADNPDEIGDE